MGIGVTQTRPECIQFAADAAVHRRRSPYGEELDLSAHQTCSKPSALADACAKTAWLIAVNKPFYPAYVWYFAGSGFWAASLTALSLPFYVVLAFVLRGNSKSLRYGVPLLGLCDTVLAVKLFGAASGSVLFFFPFC